MKYNTMKNKSSYKPLAGKWATPGALYDPRYEHDACGAGFICNIKGEKSHDLIEKALEILVNLTHRGATGADAKTGDGAGILMQVPHEFLKTECAKIDITLPEEEHYGVGIVFMPDDKKQQKHCMDVFEQIIKEEKQDFLGWRDVPTHNEVIGDIARAAEPVVKQIFIGRSSDIKTERDFERKLYVIRKIVEHTIEKDDLEDKHAFYITGLSCKTINYKGLLLADQIERYFSDLADPSMKSALALVHQRYSTNTFPTWDLAQPFRFLCHNGEINTLRGNINWMNARQGLFKSEVFGDDMPRLFPILTEGGSDSAILDNAIELLYHSGRSLPHAVLMCIPEAWQNHETMNEDHKAFCEYHSCLMEPWDGPSSIPFTDGTCIGAVLDRNGLRPSRYTVTKDGMVIMASETGVVDVPSDNIEYKGRLEPGRMFLVDMEQGRIIDDAEIKKDMSARQPYAQWLKENLSKLNELPAEKAEAHPAGNDLVRLQQIFGYTREDLEVIVAPML